MKILAAQAGLAILEFNRVTGWNSRSDLRLFIYTRAVVLGTCHAVVKNTSLDILRLYVFIPRLGVE